MFYPALGAALAEAVNKAGTSLRHGFILTLCMLSLTLGGGDISFTARDVAKFGLLYLNDGVYEGKQIVPADWVRESLQTYSTGLYGDRLGSYFRDIGYGYLWWSARAGRHHFNYAWGHGGNLIILLDELDMVIVTTANPLHGVWVEEAWEKEGAIIDLVGRFIASLPGE